ncbi:MAG: thiolase domain-containing protein [Thermodesulfobacteriota bacterium]|nr:thiolase domain-containing protein [Thermodesulfobacteriota bacterium]
MRRVAIVGAGLTKFYRNVQETPKELAYEATKMALDSCGMKLSDIDCVVHGTAPDAFDGIHMKGEYLSDGSGAFRKPYMRHFVGGGTGVFSPIHGWFHVASGMFDTCLVVAEEKMSSAYPHPAGAFLTIFDHTTEQPLYPTLIYIFAIEMNRFMTTHGYKKEDIALVAVKNKKNAMDHPSAQLPAEITVQDVLNSEIMAWPVNRLDISPTSDGAACMVLAAEHVARRVTEKPIWIDGVGWALDTAYWCTRDLYYPDYLEVAARQAYKMAGIKEPSKEIHIAEPYDPFTYKELHHIEGLMLAPRGKSVQMLVDGVFNRDGNLPTSPSGGLLGVGNPIAAAGLMKIIEVYLQLKGTAGKRQVPGNPICGVANAWGDLMQVGTVVVLRS